jgi:PAS domain-containing protein
VLLIGPVLAGRGGALRYGAATLFVVVIGVARWALAPILGGQAPLLPYIVAVYAAAYLGGLGPGLLAGVLSSFLATALYTDWSIGMHMGAWSAHIVLFLSIGVGMSLILHQLQRAYATQHAALLTAREAERQALSSAAQLRLMADALPVLIAYVDQEQRYRFNNRYYEEWLGAPPVQLLGQPVREVLGEEGYRAVSRTWMRRSPAVGSPFKPS